MYKDKAKQREANRKAQAKFKAKGITEHKVLSAPSVIPERTALGNIRVSKPGDSDYVPQCETARAFIEDRPKRPETGKRGKDIKCFADLPPDVQRTITMMSTIEGRLDEDEKAKRTARAIHYQSLFPDRYYSTGVGCAEPTGNPEIHDYNPDKPGLRPNL